MTKKDYIVIASAIKNVSESNNADKDTLRMLISELHAQFQQDNPRYNRRVFESACELTTNI